MPHGLKPEEILAELENHQESDDEDDDVELAIIPPDADVITDEEGIDENVLNNESVAQDVAGTPGFITSRDEANATVVPTEAKRRKAFGDGAESGVTTMAATDTKDGSFASDLRVLLESGEGADVTLVVGPSQMPAHSFILSARSRVFAAMLRTNMKEASNRRIEITDVQEDVLHQLLCFMYTDTAPGLESVAAELLAASDKYDLPLLKRKCEEEMVKGLSVDNAAATALLAVLHSCSGLESAAVDFIARHPEVMISDGWIDVLRGNPEAAVRICRLVAAATPKIRTSSVEQPEDLGERLTEAARTGEVDELQNLLAAGAPVDAKDGSGNSALHLAVMKASVDAVKCLLNAGANVNVKDSSEQTPLHVAAYRGNLKIMWALLTASAELDVQDLWGKTPLHWAASTNRIEAVRTLLMAGASKDVQDMSSRSPVDIATSPCRDIFRSFVYSHP
ncbi:poly [ADP-ribose] polymerase tankyrase-1-like [Schistocerca americana]|uniref:poly [ADP-ribose] polymerase tankyrase-1-like n=1 Tax=Schistocerca americana TaxID=7009 RepID=UPI001F502192|nr:poly [ADP-ribose] polymerase tankyrase-1-like [Schistocerca americana]